jgi:hypothetical protein
MFSTTDEIKFLVEPQITPYRGPIYFTRSLESAAGENVITNGGFVLVDTGRRKLLVTCSHVWKTYQEERLVDSRVRMCVCLDEKSPVVFDQHDPIDRDETLDIATFDITPVLAACGGRKFYSLDQNPPPPVKNGTRLVLLGDQGMFRVASDKGLDFGVTTYAVEVSSVDGLRFHSDISKAKTFLNLPPARTPGSSPHGGISGSPCFLVRDGRPVQLVGIVTGHLTIQGADYLCFTHARCLNPDGTINKMAD